MAVSRNGSQNGFRGKIGKSVIYPLKGQWVERSIGEITKPASHLQLVSRQVTTLITNLLRPVMPFTRIGFNTATEKTTSSAYNLACSINRMNAVKGNYPDQEIDFTRVIFSKGRLPVNEGMNVSVDTLGVNFSWDPEFLVPGMKPTDQVMVMAYCADKRIAFSIIDGARRKDGLQILHLPKYNGEILYHTYVTFIATDRKNIANSVYTGDILF